MSTQTAGRRPAPMGGPGRMMMGGGMPPAKLQDFKGTSKRLLRMLRPDSGVVALMFLLSITSVVLTVLGPRLLGRATDAKLRAALSSEIADATVVIVAQRVSTIRDADRIIVLDAGRVVGTGTHLELMDDNPTYREIVLSQLTEKEAVGA